jgi:DNA invertase Pin-like site-specific DNA recombinase
MNRLNCAIYTRKSSDEGLEKEFNSLDAQREASAAFILSQKHAGWIALPDLYDDGGLSGGTMERPALQRLLDDIKNGKVQIVVVYKVDRLTRSLADFAKIVDVLDAHGASFVSVTQQFNTTTSMGRLTLNMLLSFAQFEREIAGERIRDKIAASKAKGMWMGGNVPLGYDVKDRKLSVNEVEAETVRMIFRRYADLGSARVLGHELDRLGIVSKRRESAGGVLSGGNRFSRGALYTLLQNHLYRGEITHQGKVYLGQHQAIIDTELWQAVQEKLSGNRQARALETNAEEPSLLPGLIVDAQGQRMTPTHAVKKGHRYRYYVSTSLITGARSDHAKGWRIPAGDIEGLVLDRLRAFFASETNVGEALSGFDLDASTLRSALSEAKQLAESWADLPSNKVRELVRSVVEAVEIQDEKIVIVLKRNEIASVLLGNTFSLSPMSESDAFELCIEAKLQRVGKGIRLVVGGGIAEKSNGQLAAPARSPWVRDTIACSPALRMLRV